MLYKIPSSFLETLNKKFDAANANKDIVFTGEAAQRTVETIAMGESSMDVEFTLLPSLEKRPENGSVDKNPFAKPEPELTILDTYGAHDEFRLVFNKFPVVERHFLLLTKEFKSQDTPLCLEELVGTYTVISKLKEEDKSSRWFAFYNCGPQSGASQPHKHIQFMTLPQNDKYTPFAEKLANTSEVLEPNNKAEPLINKELPFSHFVAKLPEKNVIEQDPEVLTMYYMWMFQRVLTVLKEHDSNHISYNFVMTSEYMMMIPRSQGKCEMLGLNTCGYMGLLLCKNEQVYTFVKDQGVGKILEHCGFKNEQNEHIEDFLY